MSSTFIGRRIGGYEIKELIGEGSFGRVYLAVHGEIAKKAAIKVLHSHMVVNPVMVKRFMAEARVIGQLEHPNIVTVFDFGELEDGGYYIIMEYLRGRHLSEIMEEHPDGMEPSRVLEYVRQIAGALEVAHAKGIVHRDLKPSNIFVERLDDGSERIKILDFGIAKLIQEDPERSSVMTKTGEVLGTPAYMAPEQARGQVHEIGPWTDIYSLAVITYELLTGTRPVGGSSTADLLVNLLTKPPRSILEVAPHLPPAVEVVMDRALAKEPAERYRNVKEFVEDLEQALEGGTPVHAMATAGGSLTSRASGTARGRGVYVLAGLALLAVAGVVAAWLLLGPGGGAEESVEDLLADDGTATSSGTSVAFGDARPAAQAADGTRDARATASGTGVESLITVKVDEGSISADGIRKVVAQSRKAVWKCVWESIIKRDREIPSSLAMNLTLKKWRIVVGKVDGCAPDKGSPSSEAVKCVCKSLGDVLFPAPEGEKAKVRIEIALRSPLIERWRWNLVQASLLDGRIAISPLKRDISSWRLDVASCVYERMGFSKGDVPKDVSFVLAIRKRRGRTGNEAEIVKCEPAGEGDALRLARCICRGAPKKVSVPPIRKARVRVTLRLQTPLLLTREEYDKMKSEKLMIAERRSPNTGKGQGRSAATTPGRRERQGRPEKEAAGESPPKKKSLNELKAEYEALGKKEGELQDKIGMAQKKYKETFKQVYFDVIACLKNMQAFSHMAQKLRDNPNALGDPEFKKGFLKRKERFDQCNKRYPTLFKAMSKYGAQKGIARTVRNDSRVKAQEGKLKELLKQYEKIRHRRKRVGEEIERMEGKRKGSSRSGQ